MNVYTLLIVVFSISFLVPIIRWLYLHYIVATFHHIDAKVVQLRAKLATRKSNFQIELERMAQQYGISSRDMQDV
ncbi:hypothetical protein ACHAXS_011273 [Conticribra weissflogii]